MLISAAYAAAETTAPAASAALAEAPSAGEAFMLNLILILILVALFYVLLIMPQQKRFRQHRDMLNTLQKGDKVLTAAGFIATVDKMGDNKDEVILDLGHGVKVTALRSTIQMRMTDDKKDSKAA